MVVIPPEGTEDNMETSTTSRNILAEALEEHQAKQAGAEEGGATGGPKGQSSSENSSASKAKPQPQRRFLLRAGASKRKKQESTLMTAIHQLELENNLDNIQSHAAILAQMLESLEQEHHEYVVRENLDINQEPESTYMKPFERKVQIAVEKQKKRLGIQAVCRSQEQGPGMMENRNLKQMEDDLNEQLASASNVGSNVSTMSRGRALTFKLKGFQRKIEAKGKAIKNVMNMPGIEKNQRAIAKACMVWATIDHDATIKPSLTKPATSWKRAVWKRY